MQSFDPSKSNTSFPETKVLRALMLGRASERRPVVRGMHDALVVLTGMSLFLDSRKPMRSDHATKSSNMLLSSRASVSPFFRDVNSMPASDNFHLVRFAWLFRHVTINSADQGTCFLCPCKRGPRTNHRGRSLPLTSLWVGQSVI